MTESKLLVCEYCNTQNPGDQSSCLACGAPLEFPRTEFQSREAVRNTKPVLKPPVKAEEEIQKIAEKADEAYFTVMNTYAIAWRTVGEAVAIAVAALIIGVAGGTAGFGFLGILGALGVGVAVGLTQKKLYFVLASAPLGALAGLIVGGIFWAMGIPIAMVFFAAIFSILAAVIGGQRRQVFPQRNWWEKLRPFLGALGGLGFGILGTLLGAGISGVIALMQ